MQEFDNYAQGYSAGMENPVKNLIAKDATEFLIPKVNLLRRFSKPGRRILKMLDFGCGTGDFLKLIANTYPTWELTGTDVSQAMMREAANRHLQNATPFRLKSLDQITNSSERYDLITAVCVFHHIPPDEWESSMKCLAGLLSESGYVIVIEHNPLNPLTRWVVSRTEIDKNAVLLSLGKTKSIMNKAKLRVEVAKSFLFTPPSLPFAATIDRLFAWTHLGGQYYVAGSR